MNEWPAQLVGFLNGLPPELVLAIDIVVCNLGVLFMLRLFGKHGLFAFIVVAILMANIQVLKVVKFGIYTDPVALGTVVFTASYFATDCLTEFYGRAAAGRGIMLGFASYLLATVFTLIGMGYPPLTPEQAGEGFAWALPYHEHIVALFLPAPAFLIAGMTSYLVSQFNDRWVFLLLRRFTHARQLWLRTTGSTAISALIDNTVFSLLAFKVLAPVPVPWDALIFTYILGTYLLRLVLAFLESPFMYMARRCLPSDDRPAYRATL
ncbi:MAG TPA: queuosine precursor transporter [Verrucomicrobiae bacterium]|nr:queuosine precursor transporter [Verrucomicrobiae bacterium]